MATPLRGAIVLVLSGLLALVAGARMANIV
jgi:hypothetical protein